MTELFDAQCGFGGAVRGELTRVGAGELLAEMEHLSIGRALVRIVPEDVDFDVPRSNARLFSATRQDARLVPCPVVVPNAAGDTADEREQVAAAIGEGAGAACLRPARDAWTMAEWACGALLTALEERRLPAFCSARYVQPVELAAAAGSHPELPFILAETSYRAHRTYAALLQAFQNVYLAVGNNYCVSGGVEQLVASVGPERILFGTGFPAAEPMAGITLLMYADIDDKSRALIGSGNMNGLMREIVR